MSNWNVRYHRRLRLVPGVSLNLSKSGISTSIGMRGAHVTVGRRGVRETVGLPGSGLSATRYTSYVAPHQGGQSTPSPPFHPVAIIVGGFIRGVLFVAVPLLIVTLALYLAN